jgi:hypothetical protein
VVLGEPEGAFGRLVEQAVDARLAIAVDQRVEVPLDGGQLGVACLGGWLG